MKSVLTLLIVFTTTITLSQSNSNYCDSVVLTSGYVKMLQVQEVFDTKITYILCCDDCKTVREMDLAKIDTIIFSIEKPEIIEELEIEATPITQTEGLIPYFEFTSNQNKIKLIQNQLN